MRLSTFLLFFFFASLKHAERLPCRIEKLLGQTKHLYYQSGSDRNRDCRWHIHAARARIPFYICLNGFKHSTEILQPECLRISTSYGTKKFCSEVIREVSLKSVGYFDVKWSHLEYLDITVNLNNSTQLFCGTVVSEAGGLSKAKYANWAIFTMGESHLLNSSIYSLEKLTKANFRDLTPKDVKWSLLTTFGESLGKTLYRNNIPLVPKSELPSCHADAIQECQWSMDSGINLKNDSSIGEGSFFLVAEGHHELKTLSSNLKSQKICLDIEFLLKGFNLSSSVRLFKDSSSGFGERSMIEEFQLTERNGWKIQRLTADVLSPITENGFTLAINFKLAGVLYLKKIFGCNSYSPMEVYEVPQALDELKYYEKSADLEKNSLCQNGGLYNDTACYCPPGFAGQFCEKSCGLNKYGPHCEGVCDSDGNNCKYKMFCHGLQGCMCATGYNGHFCNISCPPGVYGAGCKEECGKCRSNETCDIYTGECWSGCQLGFVPPYCQKKYSYLTIAPSVSNVTFTSVTISANLFKENIGGVGDPRYYKLQIKKANPSKSPELFGKIDGPVPVYFNHSDQGIIHMNKKQSNHSSTDWSNSIQVIHTIPANRKMSKQIKGLTHGTMYLVRIVLINDGGDSYEQPDIPFMTFLTNCTEVQLKLRTEESTDHIVLHWNESSQEKFSCDKQNVEIGWSTGTKWEYIRVLGSQKFKLIDLAANTAYQISVRLLHRVAHYFFISTTTRSVVDGRIEHLTVNDIKDTSLVLGWMPTGRKSSYFVNYQCIALLGCDAISCTHQKGLLETTGNKVQLVGLFPFAKYDITVREKPGKKYSRITAITPMSVPATRPILKKRVVTNTSVTLELMVPENCTKFNGYLNGYFYSLHDSNGANLTSGFTSEDTLQLENLLPSKDYWLFVYLANEMGWSSSTALIIEFLTASAVPSSVLDLAVYKQSRSIIGLKWKLPKYLSGTLDYFVVRVGDRKHVHKPKPCDLYPGMFCYTVTDLEPERYYDISVAARNNLVNEDGASNYITARTQESAPEIPLNLKVLELTESSIVMEWSPPNKLNGMLRSFLIKVEQTGSFKKDGCCIHYPKQEVLVEKEQAHYSSKITGLEGGSTFTLSVMAETALLGPAATISATTRPPIPPYMRYPKILVNGTEIKWPSNSHAAVDKIYDQIISGYLLLLIPLNTTEQTPNCSIEDIRDLDLRLLVGRKLRETPFCVALEYKTGNENLELGEGRKIEGKWAILTNPSLKINSTYVLAALQIVKFKNVHNVNINYSKPFTA